jgi:hypothetical protein
MKSHIQKKEKKMDVSVDQAVEYPLFKCKAPNSNSIPTKKKPSLKEK